MPQSNTKWWDKLLSHLDVVRDKILSFPWDKIGGGGLEFLLSNHCRFSQIEKNLAPIWQTTREEMNPALTLLESVYKCVIYKVAIKGSLDDIPGIDTEKLKPCLAEIREGALDLNFQTVTVGFVGEAGLVVTYAVERMIAFDIRNPIESAGDLGLHAYRTYGATFGAQAGFSAGITIGFARPTFDKLEGKGQGVVVAGTIGIGVAVGLEYSDDERVDFSRVVFVAGGGPSIDVATQYACTATEKYRF